jgi:hypothetical protein
VSVGSVRVRVQGERNPTREVMGRARGGGGGGTAADRGGFNVAGSVMVMNDLYILVPDAAS